MTDQEIADHVERLRAGAPLDSDSVKAIAVGIGRRFKELAQLWGDKRFSVGAWVSMGDLSDLHFCKRDGQWQFRITDHSGDSVAMSHATLPQRQLAVEHLRALEKALMENQGVDQERLLEAFDTISSFADESIDRRPKFG